MSPPVPAPWHGLDGLALLRQVLGAYPRGRVAVVSSFGTESAVLLDLVARVDAAAPVLFIDTGKLFPETNSYRRSLQAHLGLTDVRVVGPGAGELATADPGGGLWRGDTDACCGLRKVRPFQAALQPFDAWITGRKRFHGAERWAVPSVEVTDDGRFRLNPLALWGAADIDAWISSHRLPRHPLAERGFPSVGCWPCTRRPAAGEGMRAGRWAGSAKTECGIHLTPGN